jgi:hypothetical protein
MWNIGGMITERKIRSIWRLTCSSSAFPSSNSMWRTKGLNVDLHGEQLASDHLGYDMAMSGVTVLEITVPHATDTV